MLLLSTSVLMLQGCSSQPTKTNLEVHMKQQQIKNDDQVKQELMAAVSKTTLAINNLSKIRRAQYPKQDKMPFTNIHDPALMEKLSIDWYGPINSIVKSLAKQSGYTYQEFGKSPKLPVLVNLNYKSEKMIVILRNIELQANNKAQIKIFPKHKIISLRYMNND